MLSCMVCWSFVLDCTLYDIVFGLDLTVLDWIVVLPCKVYCCMVLYWVVFHCLVLGCVVECCCVLCGIVLCCVVLCCGE